MDLKSIFTLTGKSKILIIFMLCISAVGFIIAYFYYSGVNQSEDPRVVETKYMFLRYDKHIDNKQYGKAMQVLDSVQQILQRTPGYPESYELGIVYNNRASILLSMALYQTADSLEKSRQLQIAKCYLDTCITIYSDWMDKNENLSEKEILQELKLTFPEEDKAFKSKNYNKIIRKRVRDLQAAQQETPRRLSVSLTNLGIIQRHLYLQTEAMLSYEKAISLWKDNYTARSNFNVLMGLPPTDRSVINKLFPPNKGLN